MGNAEVNNISTIKENKKILAIDNTSQLVSAMQNHCFTFVKPINTVAKLQLKSSVCFADTCNIRLLSLDSKKNCKSLFELYLKAKSYKK